VQVADPMFRAFKDHDEGHRAAAFDHPAVSLPKTSSNL